MRQEQTDLRQAAVQQLEGRGIDLEAIADLVLNLQKKYIPALTLADCVKAVNAVLDKQDVQYAVLTGLFLDECCEQGKIGHVHCQYIRHHRHHQFWLPG